MPAVPLPPGIDEKLSELAAEIRRLRVIRGASWLALALFALPVAAIAVDSSVALPRYARVLLFAGWAALGALAAWAFVFRRITGDVPPAELAAAIEEKYPSLSERLRTLVELSERAEPGNGSKALIAVLARETEKRTHKLNFFRAAPTGRSFRAAAIALCFGAVAVALIFFVRWYTPPVEAAYTVAVSSGDPVVKRGDPVTLTAFLKKTKPTAVLPETAVLIFREPGATAEKKLPMAGDDKAAFGVTRPKVDADFEYAVEVGGMRTDWHAVSAVDPVEVTAASSTTATAPEYVKVDPVQKRDGLTEMDVMQHGTIAYELKLNRAAVEGKLEWRPADAKAERAAEVVPLAFAADKQSATYTHTATTDGTLKFILTGEKGVKTEVPVAVRAVVDAPPRFEKAIGLPLGVRDVRPDRPLKLDLVVADDVGVSKVVVEYARLTGDKPGETKSENVPLAGMGSRRAEGVYPFDLTGKANDGDIIRVRVRVTDNRAVPLANLGPQSTTFPDNDWVTLRVSSAAAPVAEQEITGQKEKLESKLDGVLKKIEVAAKEVAKVKADADGKPKLTADQAIRLDQAREKARDAARDLDDAARDADVVPALRPLAQAAREVAERHLRPADDQLRKATNEPDADKRDEATAAAAAELETARAAVDDLRNRNVAAARDRLTTEKLNDLAEDQRKLADETAKADAAKAADLAAKQKELRDRLDKLFAENDSLKKAAEKANADEDAALAEELRRLKRKQEELDAAARATVDRGKRESTDELRKKQDELAKKAAALKDKTDTASRVGQTDPLDKKPFDEAGEKMTGDKPLDALTEQEKAARELDRLAEKLADQAKQRGDAKEAASQIAKWQEDLRRRAADAAKQNPTGLPPAARQKLQAEQKAIQKATDRLHLPPSDALQQAKRDAGEKAGQAADAVGKPDTDAAMKKSADALAKLAEQTPSAAERRAAAKEELEKLRREQDAVAREAADAVKGAEGKNPDDPATRDELAKKLKDTAEKQDELAKKLKALDTPGQEQRRDRTAAAGQQAGDDLRRGLPQDIPASQADAKRRMDRLRDALNGETPADEKAAELARMQQHLTDDLTKLEKPNADELQRLQRRQKEINREMAKLAAPDAAGEKTDARDAGQAAEAALQKNEPDADELRKKSKAVADAARKLADKMAGESDEEKLDRLAKNRAAQAQKATDAADRATDPARSREAQQQLERDIADLDAARAGDAQAAKKKAADALERLNRTAEPDKQKELQKQAADAMNELADKVKKNGDRKAGPDQAAAPKLDPADPTDPDNGLATEEQAKAARDLAKQQRDLRDELSKAAEQNAKNPPKPSAGDPLGDLAKEQAEIAKKADELAKKTDAPQPSKDAAGSTQEAADKLTAGDAQAAEKAGKTAAEQLKQAGEKGDNAASKKEAGDLAKKQEELNGKIAEAGKDPGAAASRQQRRQQELARHAKDVADKLDRAAERPGTGGEKPMGDPLKQAAEQARKAGQQMEKAGQESRDGKPDRAADARKQAGENLKQAADAAGKGAGQPMPMPMAGDKAGGDKPGAGKAAQQAGDKMAQAQGELGKGQSGKPAAGEAMKNAADQLKKAADQLAKGQGQGDGEPGDGQGGMNPGGNTGQGGGPTATTVPSVVAENLGKSWGDLPGEVKSKMLQELSAKYGEDYAKAIKLYFEQLADRK